jgi:hypothetical protein
MGAVPVALITASIIALQYLIAILVGLVGFGVLSRYREPLEQEHPYVYYGLISGVVLLPVVSIAFITVNFFMMRPVSLWTGLLVFATVLNYIVVGSIWGALFVALIWFMTLYLYWYRETLKKEDSHVYYGLTVLIGCVVLLLILGFVLPEPEPSSPHDRPRAGFEVSDSTGMVQITVINSGNLESVSLVGPDGTRSTKMEVAVGTRLTLRSNERVISYLNDPKNNITVLTTSGTKTVESVSELPSEYQKAPDGLINADANIGNYANASVATVACLYNTTDSFELGGRRVSAEVSLPCNTPVLAQNDSVTPGTNVKPTSGPNAGKTLTSPVTLRSGEYDIIGAANGEETVLRRIAVSGEVAQE